MKDCDPSLGPPCSDSEHDDQSAPIFTTSQECCDTSLGWVDVDACASTSEGGFSNKFFVDYPTGSCFKDASQCPGEGFTCEKVPPSVDVYESIEECCEQGQSWVNLGFCTSRSVGNFTNGWIVDYGAAKCGEWPWHVALIPSHRRRNHVAKIFICHIFHPLQSRIAIPPWDLLAPHLHTVTSPLPFSTL